MKRRITLILLMLSLLMSISLSVSARDSEYFEEDGVEYCWVRGGSTETPTKKVSGHTWVAVYVNGKRDTRLGDCEDAGKTNHVCDIFCDFSRLEYKWKLVVKEIMMIESLNQEGYAMVGTQFILLKQKIKTDAEGNYLLDADGKLQYQASEVVGKGEVEKDGFARMRLDESKLDPTADFQQLVLGQILAESQMDNYSPLPNRWYVNLVLNEGEYQVYNVTKAPAYNITDPEEFQKDINFGVKEGETVSEYDSTNQILTTRNAYRVGDLIVEIAVNGFDGEIPSLVRTNITISGPNNYSKKLRKSDTLEDMRMGEYTIACSNPVAVEGYTAEKTVVTVKCPVESDPVELTDDVKTVLLNRDHANAVISITYTYTPLHVHEFDVVVTEPTCTEKGYTTYTCKDGECGYAYKSDEVEAYGHDYKSETSESTCTEDGYTKYTCAVCGHTYQEINDLATGHKFKEMVIKPTCTEKGFTVYTCEKCDFSYKDNEVEATGHDYKYTGDEPPTCTEDGSKIYACINCDNKKAEAGEKATGHDYKFSKVVDPTCTENGYIVYKCTKCEAEKQEEGKAATGHKYSKEVTKATCTEKGYTIYTCVLCDYSYRGDEKAATGHNYISQVIEPTTEREGYTLHTCSVCKDTYTDNRKDKLPGNVSDDDGSGDDTSGDDNSGNAVSNTTSNSNVSNTGANNKPSASVNSSDTLIVKTMNDLNNPLSGAVVALYSGETQLRKWASTYENVSVLDNLESYVKEGESVSYILKQTKAPSGYEISEDSFTVRIIKLGGKTEVDVKKRTGTSNGNGIETGRDGKPMVTFRNMRKTTQIQISCQVEVEFGKNCQIDEALIAEYQEKQYEFVLKWKNDAGEEQTESVRLSHGGTGGLEAKLPFGTEYEIRVADAKGTLVTEFSENASGTLTAEQAGANMTVEAVLKYKVRAGEPLQVSMIVGDSESKKPLEGAAFELKDPDGTKVGTYTSSKDGELNIAGVFTAPGDYLLTQTGASQGYEKLSGGAPVIVSYVYEPDEETATPGLVQTMSAQIAHQAVSRESDGSYWIENMTDDSYLQEERKGPGLAGVILGIVGGALAVGGVATTVLIRKKRKQEQV